MSVLIETTIGDLVFDLYTEERPRSCLNFLKLCKIKYYNFCLFHSVRRNFIAQSGDPTGSGRGGQAIYSHVYGDQAKYFDLEVKPRIKHRTKGTISFVNNGNDMHGSQFFITLGDGLDFLDGKHTVFGQLSEGFEVLEKLNETICDDNHKPYQDVRISHTVVLDDPFDDPSGLPIPDRSPEPTKEQLESGRIAADEDIDDKGRSKEEIQRALDDKELEIGKKILETVGDIDDADLKPPENVLFVCKLNPVTNAEDLKIIFSRFGKIESCEIITDQKSGDSLGYGFVEFQEVESCEKAYFKMDNVLIDDRRIHVDFCQSVAKLKWQKSSAYQKAVAEKKPRNDKNLQLKDKSKKEKDKYSMIFEDDENDLSLMKKKKTDPSVKEEKNRNRKKFDDDSDDEGAPARKEERKNKGRKRRSSSSSSEDDRRPDANRRKRKTSQPEDLDRRRKDRGKVEQRGYSSDEDRHDTKKTKKRPDKLSVSKLEKKYNSSDSDSEYERKSKSTAKDKTKVRKYSDSESDTRRKSIPKRKSMDNKSKQKDKRKYHTSSDDEEKYVSKSSKKLTDTKKKKYEEDSDTEDYAKPKISKRKSTKYSSDESEDEKRRSKKSLLKQRRSRSHDRMKRKISSSFEEDRRRSTQKKTPSSSSKKARRRRDSEDSDSSS